VRMNDVSPYVECNEVKGLFMCGKMETTVEECYCLYF
jgi:hypothetical protein